MRRRLGPAIWRHTAGYGATGLLFGGCASGPGQTGTPLLAALLALAALSGAGLAIVRARERKRAAELDELRCLARRHIYHFELHLQAGVEALHQAHDDLQLARNQLQNGRRHGSPEYESRAYRQQLQRFRAQFEQATEHLLPRAWSRHGLHGALCDGPIAQALEEAGVEYHLGRANGAEHWSPILQWELYRLAGAAVAYLLEQGGGHSLHVRLRGGTSRQQRAWAVLSAESRGESWSEKAVYLDAAARWLGHGMGLAELSDSVHLCEGRLQLRVFAEARRRISFTLLDLPSDALPGTKTERRHAA